MRVNKANVHFHIWGEFFKYPKCCVESFILWGAIGPNKRTYNIGHITYGSGYVPCESCCEETKGMNREQLANWLGRDLFGREFGGMKTKDLINTPKFQKIKQKYLKIVSEKG